jgi:rod shape-determining protein MreD
MQTKPDLALVILIFVALYQGSTIGQLAGLISGLTEDVISIVPLGFYAFINTVVGFVLGLFKDKIDVHSIVFPLVLIPLVTIFKYLAMLVLSLVFSIPIDFTNIISWKTPLEIGYNLVFGMLVFLILFLVRLRNGDKVNSHAIGY